MVKTRFGYLLLLVERTRRGALTSAASTAHSGACTLVQSRESVPCQVAFFSNYDFNVAGAAVEVGEDLCDGIGGRRAAAAHEGRELAVVRRGNCSFEVKARTASERGYAALVVVNEEEQTGAEPFPMGTANASFKSSVPAVMVGSSFLSQLASCRASDATSYETARLRLYFEKSTTSNGQDVEALPPPFMQRLSAAALAVLAVVAVAVVCVMRYATHLWPEWTLTSGLPAFSYLAIVAFALALRLGTFRVLVHGTDTNPPVYNHRETDERIFETLVNSVSLDFYDYTIHDKPILDSLRLARENYGDALFIHPPVFVYACMLLRRYLGLSLPAVSLLCNATTMLLLPVLIRLGGFYEGHGRPQGSIEFWSLLIYIFCPITHFCSQKIWIDNMLTTTVVLSATIHLWFVSSPSLPTPLAMACSGGIFGLLVLNCKITGVLFAPFLLGWSMLSARQRKNPAATFSNVVIQSWLPTCLGIGLAYLPWFLVYCRTTGRLLPNAWPSASMLQNSAFLRMAIAKPALYYFESLVKFCPLHAVGLVWGIVQLVRPPTDNNSNAKGRVLLLWPCAFLVALSALGFCGAGYQNRFLLPCLPATAILGALAISSGLESPIIVAFSAVALAYSALHCLYYGVLFAPLHADLTLSAFEMVQVILRADGFQPLWGKEQFEDVLRWLQQFGCKFS